MSSFLTSGYGCAHALQFGLKDILKPTVLDVWKYMLLTKSLI
jgi:hypothetical protein